ncbi:MAG: sporulation protein YqfD [Oscillospiraceae bacterium]
MGLTRWILALCGSVRLEVCGAHPERVLNACADAGMCVYGVRAGGRLYAALYGARALCGYGRGLGAPRCQCTVKTVSRRGLPRLLRRAARYRGRVRGAAFADACGVGVVALCLAHRRDRK